MTSVQLIAWTWRIMLMLQPADVTPWADTYENTAEAFVEEATQRPLFRGNTGIEKTLSVFLSVAWFEGRYDPKAKGDCKEKKNGVCTSPPQSLCMFQIGVSNLAGLKVSADEILGDVRICVRAARDMMQTSFAVCRGAPRLDLLGHYASGGATCGGLRESRHRMQKADWIFSRMREL